MILMMVGKISRTNRTNYPVWCMRVATGAGTASQVWDCSRWQRIRVVVVRLAVAMFAYKSLAVDPRSFRTGEPSRRSWVMHEIVVGNVYTE